MKTDTVLARVRSYPSWVKVALAVYVLAFLIGTSTHVTALVRGWWLPHHPLVNAYWTSLTVLDPLAIFLLLRFPRAGLLVTLAIMLTDVGINSFVTLMYSDATSRYAVGYFVQLQTAFLGFVLGSAPFLWREFARNDAA